jgi:hypothetical protein
VRYCCSFHALWSCGSLLQIKEVTNNQDVRATADNLHIRHRKTGKLQIELTCPPLKTDSHSGQSQQNVSSWSEIKVDLSRRTRRLFFFNYSQFFSNLTSKEFSATGTGTFPETLMISNTSHTNLIAQ